MTSGSLYFKLLREDLRRRAWAVALVFLAFFFSLPIGLSLAMENAANTDYFVYNNYEYFVQEGVPHDAQWQAELLSLKTKVVLEQVQFGNGLVVFLMMTIAVVMGVSSFSYLHNKKKIDFYHSLPVRRESLFASQFTGGIFIVAAAYLINLLFAFLVALAYGIPGGGIMGPIAVGFALNLLYYCLMYAVTVVAMMMTGNLVVGLLATGVFFFFMPSFMLLLAGYCEIFFVTSARNVWMSDESPFLWAIKYLSPFSAYITAVTWEIEELSRHVPEIICSVLAFLAVSILGLQLYRIRPSEAAGKAMAFKRSMAPIRMLLVIGCGLGGGMFFWALQSKLKWGLFGIVVAVVITHCVIEIIYHFDFKKLFSDRLQMALCLAAGILVLLSFRYDWYGYDSYVPEAAQVASANLDINTDSRWLSGSIYERKEDGAVEMIGRPSYVDIEKNMSITDLEPVLAIAQEGRKRALEDREERFGSSGAQRMDMNQSEAAAVTVIGGADGPTSIFLAGKAGGDTNDKEEERFGTQLVVCYNMANGRKVRRSYFLPLSAVMDSYEKIHDHKEYKEGLYSVLRQETGDVSHVYYREAGSLVYGSTEKPMAQKLLEAYQKDMAGLTVKQRMEEMPIGSIGFMTQDGLDYMKQDKKMPYTMSAQADRTGYRYSYLEEYTQFWPVYPSFGNTMALLEEQGAEPGTHFAAGNVKEINVHVADYFYDDTMRYRELPQGAELEEIQKQNPYYRPEGYLEFADAESIELMMSAVAQDESCHMNPLYLPVEGPMNIEVITKDKLALRVNMIRSRITPETADLFKGIPLKSQY